MSTRFRRVGKYIYGLLFIIKKMSEEQLPVIRKMREEQERESHESREKYRRSLGAQKSGKEDEGEGTAGKEDKKTEVKVVIDEQRLLDKKGSIFSSRKEGQNKANIFANSKSVNIFNLGRHEHQTGAINIFTMAACSQPLLQKDPEDDLISHSSQADSDSKDQVLPEPSQRIMKYSYQQTTDRVAEFRISKFKRGNNPTKTGLLVTLQRQKGISSGLLQLVVRTQATKIIIYQGWLPMNLKIESFMGKEENIKITLLHFFKDQEQLKHERQTIKLQFESSEDSKRFKELIAAEVHQKLSKETKNEPNAEDNAPQETTLEAKINEIEKPTRVANEEAQSREKVEDYKAEKAAGNGVKNQEVNGVEKGERNSAEKDVHHAAV